MHVWLHMYGVCYLELYGSRNQPCRILHSVSSPLCTGVTLHRFLADKRFIVNFSQGQSAEQYSEEKVQTDHLDLEIFKYFNFVNIKAT